MCVIGREIRMYSRISGDLTLELVLVMQFLYLAYVVILCVKIVK